jgi:hypothetical protein
VALRSFGVYDYAYVTRKLSVSVRFFIAPLHTV